MSAPTVSVIIPNFRHAPYLPARIESVLGQTFDDLEVIVLDDCSPDDSRAVIDRYAAQDARIRTHYNEQNSGSPFRQWNKGFALADGEYVWIAESDDVAAPDFLESCLRAFDEHPSVGMVYTASHLIDRDGRITGSATDWYDAIDPQKWRQDHVVSGTDECRTSLFVASTVHNASAVVFRRSLLEATGEADASYRLSGDRDFWIRLMERTDVAFLARPLNHFRKHSQNVTSRHYHNTGVIEESLRINEGMLRRHPIAAATRAQAARELLQRWELMMFRQGYAALRRAENRRLHARIRALAPGAVPPYATVFARKAVFDLKAAVPKNAKQWLRSLRTLGRAASTVS